MRQIDHPNIVKLLDFSESRQYYYIVLELCPGGELFHQIVRLTYFSEELSRHVIVQVANALLYLHEEGGVVHRYDLFETLFGPSTNPSPVTSSRKIYYSTLSLSFPPRTRSLKPQKMKIKPTRVSSLRVLALGE